MNPTQNKSVAPVAPDTTPLAINQSTSAYHKFPASLKALNTWCLYRHEERDGKKTKVPYHPKGYRASSTNRAEWSSFEDCLTEVSKFDGPGIFANGTHTFIDLDKCVADGVIQSWALAVLERTNSYAEFSPSGTGLHIFVKGAVAKASKINGCEIYSSARYFTVTGNHVDSTPLTVNAMPAADLEELWEDIRDNQLRPYQVDKPSASTSTVGGGLIIHRPMSPDEREGKLERALSGDLNEYGNDGSAAVFGSLQILARKHQGDADAMREEFEASQLCEDWGEKWTRLADQEIENAINAWIENGRPKWKEPEEDTRPLEVKLAEMNENYCYVDESDIVVRLESMRMFESLRFINGGHLANRFHSTETKRFDPKTGEVRPIVKKEKLAKLWLEWPERRQVERIAYEPGRPRFFDGSINRWRGMGVQPIPGDITLWEQLLVKLIPDPKVRPWFEQWCAYPLQHMGTKLKSSVVMWNTLQGTGKTTGATTLSRIYGPNAVAITEADLKRPFNEWALDRQFVMADEITGGDKRESADFMKGLIAGHEYLQINQKFLPQISIRNCINFLFTSNHPNSFYIEPTDRRYCIIEVPNVKPPREFFDKYWKWLDNGGPGHLYHHLLNLSLEGFHPHAEPPMTESKMHMIDLGKSDLDRWLEEQRDAAPDAVFTQGEILTRFQHDQNGRSSKVGGTGMRTALRRMSAAYRADVRVAKGVVSLWSFNQGMKEAAPHVWAERYAASQPSQPSTGF